MTTDFLNRAAEDDLGFWQTLSRRNPGLSSSSKVMLAEMADHFANGSHRLPQSYLADVLGWSHPTVKQVIRESIEGGWLTVERGQLSGVGECNRYRAAMPERFIA